MDGYEDTSLWEPAYLLMYNNLRNELYAKQSWTPKNFAIAFQEIEAANSMIQRKVIPQQNEAWCKGKNRTKSMAAKKGK